jgi:hypothetical protein
MPVIGRGDSCAAVDQLLHKMARAREIVRVGRGIYGLPVPAVALVDAIDEPIESHRSNRPPAEAAGEAEDSSP